MFFNHDAENETIRVNPLLSELRRDCLRMQFEAERQVRNEAIMEIIISSLPEQEQDKIRQEKLALLRLELKVLKENLKVSIYNSGRLPPPPKED